MDSHVFAKSSSLSTFSILILPVLSQITYGHFRVLYQSLLALMYAFLADHYAGNKLIEHKVWQLLTTAIPNITCSCKQLFEHVIKRLGIGHWDWTLQVKLSQLHVVLKYSMCLR